MEAFNVSDKKIFLGLVILLVLTIVLIVGITFIQRPQTTSSEAQQVDPEPLFERVESNPTSIPLPEFGDDEETQTDGGDGETIDDETGDEQTGSETESEGGVGDGNQASPTLTEEEQELVQEVSDNEEESEENTSENETSPTGSQNEEANASNNGSEESSPSPTESLLADGDTYGGGSNEEETTTFPTSGVTYTTSTPVPTAIDNLPEAGAVHITLLMLGASLLLVVLGFAL